jgi:hypothetical protein
MMLGKEMFKSVDIIRMNNSKKNVFGMLCVCGK